MTNSKYCPGCEQYKAIDQFSKSDKAHKNRRYQCKECESKARKKRKEETKVLTRNSPYLEEYYTTNYRNSRLKYKFNISPEHYEKLYKEQNGLCAICGQPEIVKGHSGKVTQLSVDHDHTTNKVRSLLCRKCNIGLAILEDVSFVDKARAYLARHTM